MSNLLRIEKHDSDDGRLYILVDDEVEFREVSKNKCLIDACDARRIRLCDGLNSEGVAWINTKPQDVNHEEIQKIMDKAKCKPKDNVSTS